jgi:hypothetical protein
MAMAPELRIPDRNPVNDSIDTQGPSAQLRVDPSIPRPAATGSCPAPPSGESSPTVFSSNDDDIELKDSSTAALQVTECHEKSPADGDTWAIDPENAKNWPLGKKLYHSAVPALTGFCM